MSKFQRRVLTGTAGLACLSLLVFQLWNITMKDSFKSASSMNESVITDSRQAKFYAALLSDRVSHECPPNKYRKSFKALLVHWHVLATFYKIPYIIGCGSLLGQYRDGDIIPWDEDVDVLVDIKMFEALEGFAGVRNFEQGKDEKFHFVVQKDFARSKEEDRRRLSCTGKIVDEQIDSCSFVSPMGRVIQGFYHLDIFPYIVDRHTQKVQDVDMNAKYDLKDFFPFKECVFMDTKTLCPHNIRGVLEAAYDDLEPEYKCVKRTWVHKRKL